MATRALEGLVCWRKSNRMNRFVGNDNVEPELAGYDDGDGDDDDEPTHDLISFVSG